MSFQEQTIDLKRAKLLQESAVIIATYNQDHDGKKAVDAMLAKCQTAEREQDAYALALWQVECGALIIFVGDDRRLDEAQVLVEKAIAFYKEHDDMLMYPMALCSLGNIYSIRGEYESSATYLQQSAARLEPLLQKYPQLAQILSMVYMGLANALSHSDPTEALNLVARAIPLSKDMVLPPNIAKGLAAALFSNKGYSQHLLGDSKGALGSYSEAEQNAIDSGNNDLLATIRFGMGVVYSDTGDFIRAEQYYRKADEGFRLRKNLDGLSGTANARGVIAFAQWRFDDALRFFLQAEAFEEKAMPIDKANLCNTRRNIAIIYRQLGSQREADKYWRKAGTGFDTLQQANLRFSYISMLEYQVGLLITKGQRQQSLKNLLEVRAEYGTLITQYQTMKMPSKIADATVSLAATFFVEGNLTGNLTAFANAALHYKKAIDMLVATKRPVSGDIVANAILSQLIAQQIDRKTAHQQLEEQRQQYRGTAGELDILQALAIVSSMEEGKRRVFEYLEAFEVAWEQVRQQGNLEPELQARLNSLYSEMTRVHIEALTASGETNMAFELLQRNKAEVVLRALNDGNPPQSRRNRSQTPRSAPPRFERRLLPLIPEDTVVLDFTVPAISELDSLYKLFPADKKQRSVVYMFITYRSRNGVQTKVLPVDCPLEKLRKKIQSFKEAILNHQIKQWSQHGRELYYLLIAPLEPFLIGKKRLIVCPDSDLWELPFVALGKDPVKSPLIAQYEIGYHFSTNAVLQQLERARRSHSVFSRTLVVNPGFVGQGPASQHFEKKITHETMKGRQAVYLKKEQANRENVSQALPRATFAYIATHGKFDGNEYIELYAPPVDVSGRAAKAPLFLPEVANLDLHNLDLLVLAICRQDEKEETIGTEGPIGMAWASTIAGCRTIVIPQWPVSDKEVVKFMQPFHEKVQRADAQNTSMLTAFTDAVREIQRVAPATEVLNWATFAFWGDWR